MSHNTYRVTILCFCIFYNSIIAQNLRRMKFNATDKPNGCIESWRVGLNPPDVGGFNHAKKPIKK